MTVESPSVPDHKRLGFNFTANYQRRPYTVFTEGATPSESHLVDDQLTTEIDAAMGLFGRYQIGLGIPFTAYLSGDEIDAMGLPTGYRLKKAGSATSESRARPSWLPWARTKTTRSGSPPASPCRPATPAGGRTSATRP